MDMYCTSTERLRRKYFLLIHETKNLLFILYKIELLTLNSDLIQRSFLKKHPNLYSSLVNYIKLEGLLMIGVKNFER